MNWKESFKLNLPKGVSWLVLFLVAPSIWFHNLFVVGGKFPIVYQPFAGILHPIEFFKEPDVLQLLVVLVVVLPILAYTFFLSNIGYYCYQKIRRH